MSKFETTVVVLLIAMTALSAVTALEVRKLVRNGLQMEITMEQAEEISEQVDSTLRARAQYLKDLGDECE